MLESYNVWIFECYNVEEKFRPPWYLKWLNTDLNLMFR